MGKLEKLRAVLEEQGLESLIVTNDQNRRYLTGFTGSAGTVLVTKNKAFLFVDFRYVQQAQNQTMDFTVKEIDRAVLYEVISNILQEENVSRVGFEEKNITYYLHSLFAKNIQAELVPISGAVEKLRMIKLPEEIEKIKIAASISDAAFTHILDYIKPGISEIDIANELEFYMRKKGATSSAFDMIVASGYRSALPHGVASNKLIEEGDIITLDFGACYDGYRSDMTRTIAIGQPTEEMIEIYNIVHGALENALAHMKVGITGKEADALTRQYIEEKGFGKQYGHGSGHGIGLDIHEDIFMSPVSEEVLQEGMVLTVEPGIYLPNVGGVRIEDDVLIKKDGIEILTSSPKELIILSMSIK
ncbi:MULTISPECIES: M24 family metallopeptidase [unclassified Viridibacillus]|uniref:M24 family metallopeptidase n=1 Tax=unclassified Viridibacillus TaxID=2617942 RepID=UPI0030F8326E